MAKTIASNESILVKTGIASLVIFVLLLSVNLWRGSDLNPLEVFPVIVLFFCCGLGLVRYNFKTIPDKEGRTIDEYMENASKPRKFMMWYVSLFMTFWFASLTAMSVVLVVSGVFLIVK